MTRLLIALMVKTLHQRQTELSGGTSITGHLLIGRTG
jgi:hypothetical protein